MNNSEGKILVVYYHNLGYPLKKTVEDFLYCFNKYSDKLCYYVNAAFGLPSWLKDIEFDVIIYQDSLMSKRSLPQRFKNFMIRCSDLVNFPGYKIAFAQDEHLYSGILSQFINTFGVNSFYSVANPSEWGKIYPDIDKEKVKFHQYLTGYIDEQTLNLVHQLEKENIKRVTDIGFRANRMPYNYGSLGMLKTVINDVFIKNNYLKQKGLKIDVSNKPKDILFGMEWYRFLLKCKYALGVEGGASILDADGSIMRKVNQYLEIHPLASFKEVEHECFPGLDGYIDYRALSPRNLESCETHTCQILIEGDYNGILQPWKHYIPLKKDFSNIEEVIDIVYQDNMREEIIQRAYSEIVESDLYSYKGFISTVLTNCTDQGVKWSPVTENEFKLYLKNKNRENNIWKYIPYRSKVLNFGLSVISDKVYKKVVNYYHA